MYYLLILGGLFKNAFIYGWFFSPQICNTAYSIFILCWWSCFLLQWKIERNVKQITHTPPSQLPTYIHLCPTNSAFPWLLMEPLCCALLRFHTRPPLSCPLKYISQQLSLLVLGASFLVFSLEQHPSAYKTLQVSQRVPATLQPVLSSAAILILLKPESHYIIPLLEIIWWLPFSQEREISIKWPTRLNTIPSAPASSHFFLYLLYFNQIKLIAVSWISKECS